MMVKWVYSCLKFCPSLVPCFLPFAIMILSIEIIYFAVVNQLQELALALSLKCLSFDFVGTSVDESSDEFGTVQVSGCFIFIYGKSYMNSFNVGSCSSTILEYGGLQIPSPWKPVLEDSSTLQIFFDYYAITKPPLSKEVCTYVCFYDCIFNV